VLLGFADSEVARLVGVDEVEEFPLALVVLGPAGALSVHAVADIEPGNYRWRAGRLEPGRRGDFRETAQQLCLNQPLGGDSAYTAFHCSDLDPLLETLGSRGYRPARSGDGSRSPPSWPAWRYGCTVADPGQP
jgi:hypothetical protein